jgi:hypothetical protein
MPPANSKVARRKKKRAKAAVLDLPIRAYTIEQFCEVYNIPLRIYFELQQQGRGPRVMAVNTRTLISVESADVWRLEREAAARGEPLPPPTPWPKRRRGRPRVNVDQAAPALADPATEALQRGLLAWRRNGATQAKEAPTANEEGSL